MYTIDEKLAYRNKTLRIIPGKLLLGPTGSRLFVDYLDKKPGFCGRIDFIHKLNIPCLFTVQCSELPDEIDYADCIWYPSHLHMQVDANGVVFSEDKYITWNNVAVSCQRWVNHTEKTVRLKLKMGEGIGMEKCGEGFRFVFDATSHYFVLNGAVLSSLDFGKEQEVRLAPGEEIRFVIAAALEDTQHAGIDTLFERADAVISQADPLAEQEKEYADWFRDIPSFECSDELYNTTWWYRWYILRNTYAEPGIGNFHHGAFYEGRAHKMVKDAFAPWGHEFTQLHPLSSPMHITDCRWKKNGYECEQTMHSLIDSMDAECNFRSMMIDKFGFTWGNYSQWAVWMYVMLHSSKELVRELLPKYKENVIGVWQTFKNDQDDLQIVYDHRRTGKEYQPAFWYFRGYPDNARDETGYDWLKRVDQSIYLYLNAKGMKNLCEYVNDPDADFFGDLSDRLAKAVLEKMWDPEAGFFFDLHHETGEMAKTMCVTGVYPLWAQITGEEHLKLLDHLLNKELFAVGSGFATVSKDCPAFRAQGSWKGDFIKGRDGCMWDGPSWPYTTCIALDAIARQSKTHGHRYDKQFAEILREYSWEHYRNGSIHEPYLIEHYNAITGETLSDEVDYNHSYYIDLIMQHVVGLIPRLGGFDLHPLDIGLKWFNVHDVWMDGHNVAVEYRQDEYYRVLVDGKVVFHAEQLSTFSYDFDKEEGQ